MFCQKKRNLRPSFSSKIIFLSSYLVKGFHTGLAGGMGSGGGGGAGGAGESIMKYSYCSKVKNFSGQKISRIRNAT